MEEGRRTLRIDLTDHVVNSQSEFKIELKPSLDNYYTCPICDRSAYILFDERVHKGSVLGTLVYITDDVIHHGVYIYCDQHRNGQYFCSSECALAQELTERIGGVRRCVCNQKKNNLHKKTT